LVEGSFADFRLEHVAARAGVGKATIYRRWKSKEDLALEVMMDLAAPDIDVPEMDNTREELTRVVRNPVHALTTTAFGPVVRAMLSQIAVNPEVGDPFRAQLVRFSREAVARTISRGLARGDLRPDTNIGIATELLVGPVYYRRIFGGGLDEDFADRVAGAFLAGHSTSGYRERLIASEVGRGDGSIA